MRKVLFSLIAAAALFAGTVTPASAEVAFAPTDRATQSISVSATSQSVALGLYNGAQRVRIYNAGTATVWVRFGCAGVTATAANDIPEPAGAVETITANTSTCPTNVAVIAAGATGSVYFTTGSVVR